MFEQMKKDNLNARKEKDTTTSNLLSVLIAEIEKGAKDDGNREVNNKDILAALKKFSKGAKESITALEKAGRDTSEVKQEIEILERYLPKQMSETELRKAIATIVEGLTEKSPKMMGKIMGELKAKHEGSYDGKMAGQIAKELLS